MYPHLSRAYSGIFFFKHVMFNASYQYNIKHYRSTLAITGNITAYKTLASSTADGKQETKMVKIS